MWLGPSHTAYPRVTQPLASIRVGLDNWKIPRRNRQPPKTTAPHATTKCPPWPAAAYDHTLTASPASMITA
ncbi:MAG: hypothetical protein ACTHJ6_03730, partial [Oryzihumus sp.]